VSCRAPRTVPLVGPCAHAQVMAGGQGTCGEKCAKDYDIGRDVQDAWAQRSYERALESQKAGTFDAEIVPVSVPQGRRDPKLVSEDEEPGRYQGEEKLRGLRSAFQKEGCAPLSVACGPPLPPSGSHRVCALGGGLVCLAWSGCNTCTIMMMTMTMVIRKNRDGLTSQCRPALPGWVASAVGPSPPPTPPSSTTGPRRWC
jgi:acetyl-CoA acetyltransferase